MPGENDKHIQCPECEGAGKSFGFFNGGPDLSKHHSGYLKCFRCNGTGQVPAAMLGWIAEGKAMRLERAARGETLYSEAMRLGIPTSTLSSIEQGKIDPSDYAQ